MLIRNQFDDRETLAARLADETVAALNSAILDRGVATIALSGGSTPKLLFKALAERTDLDWSKVMITLVDERWVDDQSDRSNAKLVKDNLLSGAAAAATFVPLYSGGDLPTPERIAASIDALSVFRGPFDMVVLGMGNDGHTASFFPGGDTLAETLTSEGPIMALSADGAGEPRVTFTLPRLISARKLVLHIEGAEKEATLARALGDGAIADMPIRAVLRHQDANVEVYWCP